MDTDIGHNGYHDGSVVVLADKKLSKAIQAALRGLGVRPE